MRLEPTAGTLTLVCRIVCSALVAAPLVYWLVATNGDAYLLLLMVLLSPVAGLVLIINSLWCLVRPRVRTGSVNAVGFIFVGLVGFWVAWYFLPQFRM